MALAMITCPAFPADGPTSIAQTLGYVDCLSGQAVEIGFARLFGPHGALGQAMTLALTVYVALFALGLLSGRGGLRLGSLTPRMLQIGLVLTLATSWVAYQRVGWTLLSRAPDEIASILMGTRGSATHLFATRLDTLFSVIAQAAQSAQTAAPPLATGLTAGVPAAPVAPPVSSGMFKPADLLWTASLLLLLGTVGVLIVARIALAAVMALGPVFIVLALFRGTRGLFEGWLKAAVMLAITPLFCVLLGGGALVMIAPMIRTLEMTGGAIPLQLATSIFLASFIYTALMVLAMWTAAHITGGWRLGNAGAQPMPAAPTPAGNVPPGANETPAPAMLREHDRVSSVIAGFSPAGAMGQGTAGATVLRDTRSQIIAGDPAIGPAAAAASTRDPRIRPLGQGFRASSRPVSTSVSS